MSIWLLFALSSRNSFHEVILLSLGNDQKWLGAKSVEYGGYGKICVEFLAKWSRIINVVWVSYYDAKNQELSIYNSGLLRRIASYKRGNTQIMFIVKQFGRLERIRSALRHDSQRKPWTWPGFLDDFGVVFLSCLRHRQSVIIGSQIFVRRFFPKGRAFLKVWHV